MQIRDETQKGFLEFKKLLPTGVSVLAHERPWPNRLATLLTIGIGPRKTDIVVPDSFLDDLPATRQRQDIVKSYGMAVAGRVRCGSPETFFCRSGVAVEISVQWPVQSTGVQSFILGHIVRKSDGWIARCSLELEGLGFGRTIFDNVLILTNAVRTSIDMNEVTFYEPGTHGNEYPRLRQIARQSTPQTLQEQFLAKKTYFMGFLLADSRDCEVWAKDPWDADYLGVTQKDMQLAGRKLFAQGYVEIDSTFEYVRPTQRLLAKESEQPQEPVAQEVLRQNLPQKDTLLLDVTAILASRSAVGVIVIDLDNFKQLNDTKGHSAGDKCLDQIVSDIGSILGKRGKLYRWGQGDEFVVTLPDVSTEEAGVTAERIRRAVENGKVTGGIAVTASIGVCATDSVSFDSAQDILNYADKAMYQSKQSGKNRVTTWKAD